MVDRETRHAARLAALIAVPIALLAGLLSLWAFNAASDKEAQPSTSVSTPATSLSTPATGPVSVTASPLAPDTATACRALVAKLPATVRTAARRQVAAGAEQNAAYGDPAIVLACGTPPASYAATDSVYTLDAVCWVAQPVAGGGYVWTTVDRTVPVTVLVPAAYEAQAQWVIAFSRPVGQTLPPAASKPSGCR